MTTINSDKVASLLEKLFKEEALLSPSTVASSKEYWTSLSDEDKSRIVRSKTDYQEFYGHMKDVPLAISIETGKLLYMIARSSKANSIVEFGTSFGLSTIYLASALRDNGGGQLITTEFESSKVVRAKKNLNDAGLFDLVEIREGDALKTLSEKLPEKIDLVLLDGAKALYLEILRLVESRLHPGALIVADNTNFCPDYQEYIRDQKNGYLSVPFADDVELSVKL